MTHDTAFRALRLLPPEAAHRAASFALRHGIGPRAPAAPPSAILFGKPVRNLLGLAGGADKTGASVAGWLRAGFGFVEVGTVTPEPRDGNTGPRVWRMPDGRSLVNWMGLPNPGAVAVARHLARFRATPEGRDACVGASVHDFDEDPARLVEAARLLRPHVDFLTLNLSCPNVAHGTDASASLARVRALSRAVDVPVLAKLAPTADLDSLARFAAGLADAGAAGFVACNTLPYASRHLLPSPPEWPVRDGAPVGGYSGPSLLATSVPMVSALRRAVGTSGVVVGVGGVRSAADAKAMRDAGADAVQAWTAVVTEGPRAILAIAAGA